MEEYYNTNLLEGGGDSIQQFSDRFMDDQIDQQYWQSNEEVRRVQLNQLQSLEVGKSIDVNQVQFFDQFEDVISEQANFIVGMQQPDDYLALDQGEQSDYENNIFDLNYSLNREETREHQQLSKKEFTAGTSQVTQGANSLKQVQIDKSESIIVKKGKNSIKSNNVDQEETKNIGSYYARSLCKDMKKLTNLNPTVNKAINKVEKSLSKFNMNLLRAFINDAGVNNAARDYFTSFRFLDDLLSSEKQQDITPPIKYLQKMYQCTTNPSNFTNWKD